MSHGLVFPSSQEHTNSYPCAKSAVIVAIVCAITLLNACGASRPSNPAAVTNPTPNSASLTIAATMPAATVGSAYSGSVTASGGTAPYSYSVVSGQLPAGVTLSDSTGSVSGTPAASGSFTFAVAAADSTGLSQQKPLQMTVANAATTAPTTTSPTSAPPTTSAPTSNGPTTTSAPQSSGTTFSNLQKVAGWGQFGQGPPNFVDCSPSPCDGISFWMNQGVASPSLSGQATEFNVGGSTPYSDALWNNHLIGPMSTQGTFDTDQKIVPNVHNFTYDVYFYGDNLELSQALEFDINQFFNNMGFIFGHECRIASGNEWDVFDNQKGHWVPTGIPCYPKSNAWNHLTIQVQRTSDNNLLYQSITLNGVTSNLNWTFGPGSANGWYGVTINYQMDGNQNQASYNVYLDNVSFTFE